MAVDAKIARTYVSRLERNLANPNGRLENPTVNIVERLAGASEVEIVEFFREPEPGETAPQVLQKGRKQRS